MAAVARRVLSVQSHVTSGYVGNRAAAFPLQLLGYDVDILNSCQLSNHTGYKHGAPGIRLDADDLRTLLTAMRANGLLASTSHLLTGFVATPSCLLAIADAVTLLRAESSRQLVYVCDPVLGDNGKLYVPEQLIDIYKRSILPFATVLTPNAFELSLLTNSTITNEQDTFAACNFLHHRYRIPTVIVTGTMFHNPSNTMSVLVSRHTPHRHMRFAVDTNYIHGNFTGTGDLMAALLLVWSDKFPEDPVRACSNATASVSAVLANTTKFPKREGQCPFPELRLIQSQKDILDPPLSLVSVRHICIPQ
ncbi:unnamed protein product [Agarophyton chilense]